MGLIEHVLAPTIVLAPPLYEHFGGQDRVRKALKEDGARARRRIYHRTSVVQWLGVLVVVGVWAFRDRP